MSQSTTPPPLERQTALIERFTTASAQGWQQAWDWWSERSNPIVVKEARQSLNSNQFVICFGITLVAVLLWTMYSVFSQLPNAYYLPGGLLVLTGYFVILSFPLILVIPFSAYRSMMLEAESRTFELVSISGLSAKQIVQGKMSSACLQIAIYLSAMLPCIVITYLLRGISVSTILIYLYFMVIASVVLSAIAIMIATVSRQRFLQVFSNLFILGMQLVLFYVVCAATIAFVYSFPMMSWVNAPVIMSIGTIALTTVPLCMQCSAAAIDFPSENHAVAVRSRFLVWIGTIFFWCAWVVVTTETAGHWVWIYSVLLAIFLMRIGARYPVTASSADFTSHASGAMFANVVLSRSGLSLSFFDFCFCKYRDWCYRICVCFSLVLGGLPGKGRDYRRWGGCAELLHSLYGFD